MKARTLTQPLPAQPVAEALASFFAGLRFEDIAPGVIAAARRSFLDSLGIAVRAHQTEQAASLLAEVTSWGGPPEATVIGTSSRLPAPAAGLVGGLLCHSFDFDDTHLPAIVHPSACVVPGALAMAESAGLTGRDLLLLLVTGYEMMARIGRTASGQFQIRGLHATSICGVFGVAALAARALGAGPLELRNAIGCAASFASGILEPAHDGTWTKLLQTGWAVHGGIAAARMAMRGYRAPVRALEGEFGFYRAFVDDDYDLAILTGGLGTRWETPEISIKLYPACHHIHAFLDATFDLVAEEKITAEAIERIELSVGEPQSRLICEPWPAKCRPDSDYAARFSLPYALGAALIDGHVSLDQYTQARITDPAILALATRMSYRPEPNPDFPRVLPGDVAIVLKDGRRFHRRRANCRGAGSGSAPITLDDVVAKFRVNAAPILGERRAQELIDTVDRLEGETVGRVLRLLVAA